jgi:hypothetical protein
MSAMRTGVLLCLLLTGGVSAKPAKTFVLTGRVLDAITGQPIALARVSDDSGAFAYSDSLGNYRLPLTRNTMYEKAEATGMCPAWIRTPNTPWDVVRDFHMFSQSSPAVEGLVTDFSAREPMLRAEVRNKRHFVLTDSLGRFLLPVREAGQYTIRAELRTQFTQGISFGASVPVLVPVDSQPFVRLSMAGGGRIDVHPPELDLWSMSEWPTYPYPAGDWRTRRHAGAKNRQHADWSEFMLELDCIERVGGLEKAVGDAPGVLIR